MTTSAPSARLERPYFGTGTHARPAVPAAPFLPTTREEMDALGWDACDVILINGDAYIDHVSFGAALI